VAKIFEGRPPLAKNASLVATEVIREAILDGRLVPGQRLKEEELARELGISRTPVREALLVLQTEGMVEAAPNRGATVRSYDADDLGEMYLLRAALEGLAARLAAERVTPRDLAKLHKSCDRFESAGMLGTLKELVKENLFFHNTILDVAGSERISQLVRSVTELPLVYKSYLWYSPSQKLVSAHYHRQIVHALEAGDPERAESVMKQHVFEARDVLMTQVRASLEASAPTSTAEGEQ
jgi:DNA-binding GntR family transcriptional regulator